jgi:Fe2+ transport system protein FeoA
MLRFLDPEQPGVVFEAEVEGRAVRRLRKLGLTSGAPKASSR